MNFLILLIAFVSTTTLTLFWLPINIIYHIFTFEFKTGYKRVMEYFYQLALSIDQFANVSLKTPLNYLMIKKSHKNELLDSYLHNDNPKAKCALHGDADDTISYIIARNQQHDALTKFGKFWAWFLNWADFGAKRRGSNHLEETLKMKRKRDLQACRRIRLSELNLN